MKTYNVKVTDAALADVEEIYNYIAFTLLSPANAIAQYDRIAEAILSLNILPERFKVMNFTGKELENLRRMPVDNFSVFYVITDDSVIVTNVLYSASDISQRLQAD